MLHAWKKSAVNKGLLFLVFYGSKMFHSGHTPQLKKKPADYHLYEI